MSLSDYLVDSVLVLIVLRQLRESRLDRRTVLLPLVIVAVVAKSYLHDIPTGATELAFIGAFTLLGVVFGLVSAATTRVRSDGGRYALVRAGWIAAGSWVLSMGFRFAFAVWASHGGGPQLYRWSAAHHLDVRAWTPALVLMALGEVVTRVGLLVLRGRRAVAAQVQAQVPVTV